MLYANFRSVALYLTCGLALLPTAAAQTNKIFINDKWPIQGPKGPVLSPPHVELTNECSKSVYVDSFVPHASITVFLNGTTVIGGPFATEFGFADVPLTQALKIGDHVTATQTVNGVTSAHSTPPMIVGKMPASLPTPAIDPKIYACGHTVPVHNLVPGVTVEVRDLSTVLPNTVIGNGATPNLWGSDWDPVSTSALVKGHQITARQSACTGVTSNISPAVPVQPEPSPVKAPTLDTPIVGNDAITAHGLDTGSILRAFQPGAIGSGTTTAETNWMPVAPPIKTTPGVSVEQDLCTHSPQSPPVTPTTKIPPPSLVGPICPGEAAAIVRNTTINATLVLLKNNAVIGYGGAAPGDVPLDVAPPASFVQGDTIQVVEYIGSNIVFSNVVKVGCTSTVTYHNDSQRTGWNSTENTLTPVNVRPATFGLIASVLLDDQVDTQPLVVTNQLIENQGIHTVVYVTTESNTVYALDSWSGSILRTVNLGAPVPMPLGCTNNGPNVGINGTPTIDVRSQTMWVVAYTLAGGKPTYRLHALDLATLADKPGSPKTIAATRTLTNGTAYSFNAAVQRQRSALLLANGNVYVAFASFCDFKADQSRGWLLGWNSSTLNPLPANELADSLGSSPDNFFLSSIWMSGYGVASDPTGNLFFVTGNSDYKGNAVSGTYTGTTNIQESVVKMPLDLSKISSLFTPSNVVPLDHDDTDYGSGGVMVLPDQPGKVPHVAVAAGKDGRMFILNRDAMGGFHNPDIPKNVAIGGCWCGPSYYKGSDGVARVVSSGAFQAKTWKVNTNLSPALLAEAAAPVIPTGAQPDGGFFTTVSSNGTSANTAIIWAVGRPTGTDNHLSLYAYNGTASGASLPLLWSGAAGTWPSLDAHANIVPTVANGRVYVPSYHQLDIFGLTAIKKPASLPLPRRELITQVEIPPPPILETPGAHYWGTIQSINGSQVAVTLRSGKLLQVDLSEAIKEGTSSVPVVGRYVSAIGSVDSNGLMHARILLHTKGPASWGTDKDQ